MLRHISGRSIRKYMQIQNRSKTWAVTNDGTVKIVSMTDKSLEGAIRVMRESCFIGENLCKAVDLLDEPGAVEEMLNSCKAAVKDGVSLVAVDSENSVVGVAINKIHTHAPKRKSYYEILSENSKFMSSKAIFDFSNYMDNKADVFTRYKVDTVLEIIFIAVMEEFKQKHIGQLLALSTVELVKQIKENTGAKTAVDNEITNAEAIPQLVVGLSTSAYAHKYCDHYGSSVALEVKFEDFKYKGRKFSERIGDLHSTCRVFCFPVY